MQPAFDTLRDLGGTIALMALLSVAYGTALRAWPPRRDVRGALGLLFGAAAALAMLHPIPLAPGVIADMRALPLVLAGAFLGPEGAVAAALVAAAARWWIGGAGALSGLVGIAVAVAAGLLWARRARRRPRRGARGFAGLAALSCAVFLVPVLAPLLFPHAFPPGIPGRFLRDALPYLLPLHVAGVLALGSLMERERRLAQAERRLRRVAGRDALTGLLNRRGLRGAAARLAGAATGRAGAGAGAALAVIDLDRFKQVNDAHGHAAGDAVLRALGPRLKRAAGPDALVARLGGEEIVALLPAADGRAAAAAAGALWDAVRAQPFALPGGARLPVTASVGAAWAPGPPDLPALMARADAALYAAKRAGRDRVELDLDGPARPDLDGPDLDGPGRDGLDPDGPGLDGSAAIAAQ